MNKSFILFDRNNNVQKTADIIVKFIFEGKDYLIYSIDENEQNSQVFVSRLILNSEGNLFVDNISVDEKVKLNNIVYNIVILLPNEAEKNSEISFDKLINNFVQKYMVKLSLDFSELNIQEYYSSCSVAITNKSLVNSAIKFYNENLKKDVDNEVNVVPTWTAPVEVTAPVPTEQPVINNVESLNVSNNVVSEPVILPNQQFDTNNVQPESVSSIPTPSDEVVSTTPIVSNNESVMLPNPQAQKLAIVSDPSLGIGVNTQPNVGKNKKAGFANTKYIVIGSICLVLAIGVVVAAYFLISNLK